MPGRGSVARLTVTIGVSAFFLALLLRRVDGGELVDSIRGVNPLWVLAAAVVFAVGIWLRAERWRFILNEQFPISSRDTVRLVLIGASANNLLPVRAGEILRAILVQRHTGGSRLIALGSIVVERVLDGLVLVAFLAVALSYTGTSSTLRVLALGAGILFMLAVAVLVFIGARTALATAAITWMLRFAPGRLRPRAREMFASLIRGLGLVHGTRRWALVLLLTLASWSGEALSYWLIGRAFGIDGNVVLFFGAAGAANLAITAPSAAGGIGPFEFFAREVLVAGGVAVTVATAYALVLHAFALVPITVAGALLLWRHDLRLSQVLSLSKEDTGGGSSPEREPTVGGVAVGEERQP